MNSKYIQFICVILFCGFGAACSEDLDSPGSGRPNDGLDVAADVSNVERDVSDISPDSSGGFEDAGESDDAALDDVVQPVGEDVAEPGKDVDVPPDPVPCKTRITYGTTWMGWSPSKSHDDVNGRVTWDGACAVDGSGNAFATLSNGWKPFFQGRSCVIALDYSGECAGVPKTCQTRVSYGPAWDVAANHPVHHDDVQGVVTWDGTCWASGGKSVADLSNGWSPHFRGANSCDLAFRHEQCGGLFQNPVIAKNCPDPSVLKDGSTYYLTCTHTGGTGIFQIYTSKNMVNWTRKASILASKPGWANDRFWAPEIHRVKDGLYVAYYTASTKAGNRLSIGAATASSPLGPYKDLGRPLINDPTPGVIDAHYFQASDGKRYLTWKRDGNAVGKKTPILIQEIAADGVTLRGSATEILTNDKAWEAHVVEGQWIIEHGGFFYLFYSGNGYASANYGIGVARSKSVRGPYTKAPGAILKSSGTWDGPGHGAVVRGPSGDWVHVYHAWPKGKTGQEAVGRHVLVDRITWADGWPRMIGAPSRRSQPLP